MNEPNKKRRRTDQKGLLVDTEPRTPETEIKIMQQQMEPIFSKQKTGMPATLSYRPTYRAELAKKGYLVRESIGSGTYSKVKKALNLNPGKHGEHSTIAVKIIDRRKAPQDYQQRFMPRELKLWPELDHAHIVKLIECFEDEQRIYMVHEYADGGDVLRYVQTAGALNETMAQKWTGQIIDAVRYLHEKNVAHRDLKLENLLLDEVRNIKICDFGFVKELTMKELSKTYCGSKSYAAPEILIGQPYEPFKADVWAIGVILYILVTGKMPFDESKGNKFILSEQRAMDLYWPKLQRVSQTCKDLIRYALTYDFHRRPTIQELFNHEWLRSKLTKCHPKCLPTVNEEIGTNVEYTMNESH
ncbi:unnamed protein product [Owenia fusiformis]|uniref:Protein kinase domain-containing protein n=1 Tax=Owenia fusiformis TaxID=6347 RepID=A0A8J1XWW3_OWEFU|nr:unnamed protein product [Owenia fusiformis]